MDDPTSLIENHDFITDCARYAEGLYSEQDVKKKYHFDDDTWERLGENDALVEAIEAEKTRRIRNGSTKRERAQQLVAQAPEVLGGIMLDASASPKHRIDASKTLDAFAANGPEATPASERLDKGRPPPTKKAQEPSPAQKLLNWLQHWPKPTVSARDICIYGPNSIRDRERAIDSAEILVKNGWLVPIKTRRHDMREWQIVRKPIIHPTVATEAAE